MSQLTLDDLKVDIKVNGKTRNFDFNKELAINHENPSEFNREMAQQPAKYAWMGILYSLAVKQHGDAKSALKTKYAQLDKKHRKRREEEGVKITESLIEADIERDKEYTDSVVKVLEAELNMNIMRVATDAFEQRKDMLISIGSNLRHEMNQDINIKKAEVRERIRSRKEQ